jgi:ABC-2 type transport system permease protein
MKKLMRFLRIWKKGAEVTVSGVMAYKTAFFILCFSLVLGDICIPVVSAIIYNVSAGIPGWSLYEFILFQGTLIIVMGIWQTLFADILEQVISANQEGSFDKILLKPFSALAFVTSNSFSAEGIAEIIAGLAIVGFALIKLNIFSALIIPYILIILLAVIFEYSLTIITAALSFIFVRTNKLFEVINMVEKVSRYPVTIYSPWIKFTLLFLLPAAIAAFYPVSVLLGKASILDAAATIFSVLIFFTASLIIWNFSIKRYISAGG